MQLTLQNVKNWCKRLSQIVNFYSKLSKFFYASKFRLSNSNRLLNKWNNIIGG